MRAPKPGTARPSAGDRSRASARVARAPPRTTAASRRAPVLRVLLPELVEFPAAAQNVAPTKQCAVRAARDRFAPAPDANRPPTSLDRACTPRATGSRPGSPDVALRPHRTARRPRTISEPAASATVLDLARAALHASPPIGLRATRKATRRPRSLDTSCGAVRGAARRHPASTCPLGKHCRVGDPPGTRSDATNPASP